MSYQQGFSTTQSTQSVTTLAIPAFNITSTGVRYGNAQSCSSFLHSSSCSARVWLKCSLFLIASVRSFTPIKILGEGAFSKVWLCDWHGPLPPNTPISTMQSVVGTRPEYANMRLVAVKCMTQTWEAGWDVCKRLKELEVRALFNSSARFG
jgi:meiosis induction protein kinase IME2/SME1